MCSMQLAVEFDWSESYLLPEGSWKLRPLEVISWHLGWWMASNFSLWSYLQMDLDCTATCIVLWPQYMQCLQGWPVLNGKKLKLLHIDVRTSWLGIQQCCYGYPYRYEKPWRWLYTNDQWGSNLGLGAHHGVLGWHEAAARIGWFFWGLCYQILSVLQCKHWQ